MLKPATILDKTTVNGCDDGCVDPICSIPRKIGIKMNPAYVKAVVEAEGYTLHDEYIKNKIKMRMLCANGHNTAIAWDKFNQGKRCAFCYGNSISPDTVYAAVANEGYKLHDRYKNNRIRMRATCPNGHDISIMWRDFSNGSRCGVCAGQRVIVSEVYAFITNEGYTLHDCYINNRTRMRATCPDGHDIVIIWDKFNQGRRCPGCTVGGFNPLKPSALYYLKMFIDNNVYYKIGVTNNDVITRYKKEKTPYLEIFSIPFDDGYVCYGFEQYLHREFADKNANFRSGDVLTTGGDTELYTEDVLGSDRDFWLMCSRIYSEDDR